MKGSLAPRVTWTGSSRRPPPPVGAADAIGPGGGGQDHGPVHDGPAAAAPGRDERDGRRLRGPVRGAREDGGVVEDAEVAEDVEDLVGDGVARCAEADRRLAGGPLDRPRALLDLTAYLGPAEADEIVAVVERVVGDLEAAGVGRREACRGLRALQIAANREEGERDAELLGELAQPPERHVVDERALRSRGLREPMDTVVVGDLVEVDAHRADAHDPLSLGELRHLGGEVFGRGLLDPLAQ